MFANLVIADIVHIQSEPVAGAMHIEPAISLLLDQFRHGSFQQLEFDQPPGDNPHRGIMRIVPVVAGLDLPDRGGMRGEHDVVNLALGARILAVNWKSAGNVRGVTLDFATCVDQQ